ncbi:hypothetical protein, conserved [Babesia ovata]|uniref:Uncharacterized protein n=1 Tax=Babesia ovata TaxID=189622 RepID=A0A2H6K8T2_9APIC|nr:uncharacterized protein BOVATA_008970 [Babesia ovata]GBE59404.1 hypothetical protein, conserved [Babesia ovata]
MAPKKLTDCPENLRESIDWLIQVKHGNGNDGLGPLAEAVKKLIGDAVKQARESLDEKQGKIGCAADYYGRQYCKRLDERIATAKEELKELKSDENNVAEKKDLESQIKRYEANKKNCEKDHHMDPSTRDKALKEIESQRKVVEQLEEFITGNNPRDLLESLCTGLEKFLGLKDGNYTGKGIVYSDLDRLCDGVMSFLHGVLKDVCANQPYTIGRKELKTFVDNEIQPRLCSGHQGFRDVIGQVADKVRDYNESLERSNRKVKSTITALEQNVDYFTRKVSLINDNLDPRFPTEADKAVASVKSNLEECLRNANKFNNDLDIGTNPKDIKNAINDLNSALRDRVNKARDSVKIETDHLTAMSKDQSKVLREMTAKIGSALSELRTNLHKEIDEKIPLLVSKLRERVRAIKKQLEDISGSLFGCVQDLERWIQKGNKTMEEALLKVNTISGKVDENSAFSNVTDIKQAADKLRQHIDKLFQAKDSALEKVRNQVAATLMQVKEMDGKLKEDLYEVKKGIKTKVEEINVKIGALYGVVKDGTTDDVQDEHKKIAAVIGEIQGTVGAIVGPGGLGGIKTKLNTYIGKFTATSFESKVLKVWIGNILGEDKTVMGKVFGYNSGHKEHFTTYFRNGGSAGTNTRLNEKIREEIINKVKMAPNNIIQKATASFQKLHTDGSESIKRNFEAVKDVCQTFADELKTKIQGGSGINTFAGKIAAAVNGEVINPLHLQPIDYTELTSAIEYILVALQAKGSQVSKELQSLALQPITNNNIAKYLENALTAAGELNTNLEKALGEGSAANGTNYADKVDTAIDDVSTELTTQIGEDNHSSTITTLAADDDKFQGYRGFVDQDQEKLQALAKGEVDVNEGDPEQNKLPKAIKKIQSEMDSVLDPLGAVNTDAEYKLQLLKQKLKTLCEDIKNAAGDPNGLKKILEDFKNKDLSNADHQLSGIRNKISELQSKLESGPIRATENFIQTESNQLQNEYIQKLKEQVQHQVRNATDKLTTQAKKHHVITTKLLLKQFASRVTKELDGLPQQIEGDRHIGFKGFMEKFYGDYKRTLNPNNIDKLLNAKGKNNICDIAEAFRTFFEPLKNYIQEEIGRTNKENHSRKNPSLQKSENNYVDAVDCVDNELAKLFHQINAGKYDSHVPSLLDGLADAIEGLKPESFSEPNTPLLEALGAGLSNLVGELRLAYISAYDRQDIDWTKDERSAANCAKVFLTSLPTLFNRLHYVFYECCNAWKTYKMQSAGNTKALQKYLQNHGYDVENLVTKNNTGRDVAICLSRGFNNYDEFIKEPKGYESFDDYVNYYEKGKGVLSRLFHHLNQYNEVCHLVVRSEVKTPCSIYEMLAWCSGLTYNVVNKTSLRDSIVQLFSGPDAQKPEVEDEFDVTLIDTESISLDAYPNEITYKNVRTAIKKTCSRSRSVLTSILGHGHAGGIYACDFSNNSLNLHYPTDMNTLICVLLEILKRLYHQLYFLYQQCCYKRQLSGWSDCWYGKGIAGSAWNCHETQCPKQDCNQKHDQHTDCGIKSPLQSFLEDGLLGFLPHELKSEKGKLECSVKQHFNVPCITPMGFWDITEAASHRQTGQHIKDVLGKFCGDSTSCLTVLLSQLNALLPSAPKTLGDMFAFYYQFLNEWDGRNVIRRKNREEPFTDAVTGANFKTPHTKLEIAPMFGSTNHKSGKQSTHVNGDLYGLCNADESCYEANNQCGTYMTSIGTAIYTTFAAKNAAKHLSWVVYLTDFFYDLLCQLCGKCSGNCGVKSSKCRVTGCAKSACGVFAHSVFEKTNNAHGVCDSIIKCPHTHPTLYAYGFTFGNRTNLEGKIGEHNIPKRTCKKFIQQLNKGFGHFLCSTCCTSPSSASTSCASAHTCARPRRTASPPSRCSPPHMSESSAKYRTYRRDFNHRRDDATA